MLPPMPWAPNRAYNDLPRLPPAFELETKPVLKQCIAARAALAELKQAAELLPNPAMLINTLPLLEAQANSAIENIVTSADKLFQQLQANAGADPATREALRYRRALLEGVEALKTRPLTTLTAESICTQIRGVEMSVRKVPGIALANDATAASRPRHRGMDDRKNCCDPRAQREHDRQCPAPAPQDLQP